MNDPQSFDIRRRIRELLSIPDRDRTDAEWDELNELEIRTAPGNRDTGYAQDRPDGKRASGFVPGRRNNHGAKNTNPRPEGRPAQENRPEGYRSESRSPLKRQHRRSKPRPQQEIGGNPANGAGTAGNYADAVNGGSSGANGGVAAPAAPPTPQGGGGDGSANS